MFSIFFFQVYAWLGRYGTRLGAYCYFCGAYLAELFVLIVA